MPGPLIKGSDGLWYEQRGNSLFPYSGINPDQMQRAQQTAREMGPLGAAGMSIVDTLGGGYWAPGAAGVDPNQYQADIMAMRGQHPIAAAAGTIGAAIPGAILGGPTITGQMIAGGVLGGLSGANDPLAGVLGGATAGAGTMAAIKGVSQLMSVLRPAQGMAGRVMRTVENTTGATEPGFINSTPTGARSLDELAAVAGEDVLSAGGTMPGQPGLTMGGVVPPMTSARHQGFVTMAERSGLELLPGQKFGNRALQQVEAAMESNPLIGATVVHPIQRSNQEALNRLVNRAMGSTFADGQPLTSLEHTVGPETVGLFRQRLGDTFQRIYRDAGPVSLDAFLEQAKPVITSLQGQAYGADKIAGLIANRSVNGMFNAQELAGVRNFLSAQHRALSQDAARGVEAGIYENFVNALDNVVAEKVGGQAAQELTAARQGWRLLKALERPAVVSEKGNVATGPLYRSLLKSYRDQLTTIKGIPETLPGNSEAVGRLLDGIRAAEYFKGTIGDSGTATRLAYKDFMDMSLLGGATRLASPLLARAYMGAMRGPGGQAAATRMYDMANQARAVFEAGLQ